MKIIIPLTVLCALLAPVVSLSQGTTFSQPAGTSREVVLPTGTYSYFDSGGPANPYGNGESGTITFCPLSDDEIIRVVFTDVDIEVTTGVCTDVLQVSGDVDAKNGDYCGTVSNGPDSPNLYLTPGTVFTGAPGGCLTFSFTSDSDLFFAGWSAIVDVREPMGCVSGLDCGQTLICENFEEYAPWLITPQSADWSLGAPLSADAQVDGQQASDGGQSLRLQGVGGTQASNVALGLGDRTTGRYRLSWNMLIPMGNQGRYSLFHDEGLGNRAFEVTLSGAAGQLFVPEGGGAADASFAYQPDAWNSFVHIIDLGKDSAQLWVNGGFVAEWKFSEGSTGASTQLGAINFATIAICYVDEILLTETGCASPPACQGEDPCPVTVNGRRYASRCLACCAGYTSDEWEEDQSVPRITRFSNRREWVDQGDPNKLDISLVITPTDTMLFVDISAIDTLDFRPGDVVLSNYCPAGLRVTVEDQRPPVIDQACYTFHVIWRVEVGSQVVDSLVLPVNVECKEIPRIDSLVYAPTGAVLYSGDTLRLTACPLPDTSAFDWFGQTCAGRLSIVVQRRNVRWIGDLPPDQRTPGTPCFREETTLSASQCNIPAPPFTFYTEIYDRTRPLLTPPRDTTVACVGDLDNLDKTGRIRLASDSCGVADTSFVDDRSLLDQCSGIVRRTWRVVDSCGNASTAVQMIMVNDTLAPTFTAPPAVTINGANRLDSLVYTGRVTNVADNCGVIDTLYIDDRSGLLGCSGVVRRTWRVVDRCGNRAEAEQLITVLDNERPRFTVPADRQLDCLEDLDNPARIGDIANVADNVGVLDTQYIEDRSGLMGCTGTVVRTWIVSDSCGNQQRASQRLTVRDTIPPTFVAPFQVTINCREELNDLSVTGIVLFVSDNCGILDTIYRDSISQVADCVSRIVRTWTVRDRCGNATTRTQRIFLADTEPPEFRAPAEARVRQSELFNLAVTGTVRNVTDNCTIRDTLFRDTTIRTATCSEPGWIIRIWRVEDWCGNYSEATQDIFYTLDLPVSDAGADKVVTCRQPVAQLDGTNSSLGGRFTYRWSTADGNIVAGTSSPVPTVDAPGLYTLTVRDTTTGCQTIDQVRVTQNNDLVPELISKTDVLCYGASSGAITVAPRGGNPPYRLAWSTGAATATIRDLPAGVYTVTVTDNGNCRSTLPVTIAQPDSLVLETTVLRQSGCTTPGTGQVQVAARGGMTPYAIRWSTGDTSAIVSGLSPGAYSVTVRDGNGCSAMQTVRVQEARTTASLAPLAPLCDGEPPLQLTGGTPAGGVYVGPGVTGGRFDPSVAGVGTHAISYIFVAANGCADTARTTLRVNPLPQLTDEGLDPICLATDTVRLNFIKPAGGIYRGPGISSGNLLRPGAAGAGSFPILYTYRDVTSGCTNSLATLMTIESPAEVTLDLSASATALCENEELEVTARVSNAGSSPAFDWRINGQPYDLVDSAVVRIRLPAGRYVVRGTVTANDACVVARTAADSLVVQVDSVTIAVTAPAIQTVCTNFSQVRLPAGTPAGGFFEGPHVLDSLFLVSTAGLGSHLIAYTVVDPVTGCLVSDTFRVNVQLCTSTGVAAAEESSLTVFPNPATEHFEVRYEAPAAGEVLILQLFDSQGRLVRQQTAPAAGARWTGRVDAADLPPGLYWLHVRGRRTQAWQKVVLY